MAKRLLIGGLLLAASLLADNYDRTKDCAAQAEKHAAEKQQRLLHSHYSPKYQRCFALTSLRFNDKWFITVLADAYEGYVLAEEDYETRGDKVVVLCHISEGVKQPAGDDSRPCPVVVDLIMDHMNH